MYLHFLGRLDDIGHDGMELIAKIAEIFDIHDIRYRNYCCIYSTSTAYYRCCIKGAHIATTPLKYYNNYLIIL